MASKYYKKLYKIEDRFLEENSNLMGLYEGLVGNIIYGGNIKVPPFDDSTQWFFPVLEETPYSRGRMSQELAEAFGKLIQIPELHENEYEEKIEDLLKLNLTKDLFKEHSLFLMKEHCKLFSPYCEKTKELFKKLESLDE